MLLYGLLIIASFIGVLGFLVGSLITAVQAAEFVENLHTNKSASTSVKASGLTPARLFPWPVSHK